MLWNRTLSYSPLVPRKGHTGADPVPLRKIETDAKRFPFFFEVDDFLQIRALRHPYSISVSVYPLPHTAASGEFQPDPEHHSEHGAGDEYDALFPHEGPNAAVGRLGFNDRRPVIPAHADHFRAERVVPPRSIDDELHPLDGDRHHAHDVRGDGIQHGGEIAGVLEQRNGD